MRFLKSFENIRLDVVGIIAVLGEGSVTRNSQCSALSWHNFLPRLFPAPQALLETERKKRLPTAPGVVAGAYNGNIRHEINFFAQLLHPEDLEPYEVELVEVTCPLPPAEQPTSVHAYDPKEYGLLFALAVLGCGMSIALIVLAALWDDGFGLLAVVLLSAVAVLVGLGTHWTLVFPDYRPLARRIAGEVPRSDVVIYYPHGAFRIIRCEERISRLYFDTESCKYSLTDTPYRAAASMATVLLMAAVVSLANAINKSQTAFVAAYLLLNFLFWICSAISVDKHWKHPFHVRHRHFRQQKITKSDQSLHVLKKAELKSSDAHHILEQVQEKWQFIRILYASDHRRTYEQTHKRLDPTTRNFTSALWTAIALTGTNRWLNDATHIAPKSNAWADWIEKAGQQVAREPGVDGAIHDKLEPGHIRTSHTVNGIFRKQVTERVDRRILLPDWDYQTRLTELLKAEPIETRTAPQMSQSQDIVNTVPRWRKTAGGTDLS